MKKFKSMFKKKSKKPKPEATHVTKNPQRVIIPAGVINPAETTVVEIPENLQNVEVILAKPKAAPAQSPQTRGNSSTYHDFNPRAHSSAIQSPQTRGNSSGYHDFNPRIQSSVCQPASPPVQLGSSFLRAETPYHYRAAQRAGREMGPQGENAGLVKALDVLDLEERERIQQDLKAFQKCRRRLIFKAASLSRDVSSISEQSRSQTPEMLAICGCSETPELTWEESGSSPCPYYDDEPSCRPDETRTQF